MLETPTSTPALPADDMALVARVNQAAQAIRAQLAKAIVGQDQVIEQLLLAILAQGHCLLEGVPGLAKTLMVSTLARSLNLNFSRVQFTPDLMPSDITGTEVIQEDRSTGTRAFKFLPGPIFANMILADEINRTPPKTQAALLEAMQERQVTIDGSRHPLPAPFFVLATQNPIEQEGTYTLPEAQQDRFMFKVFVHYPSYDEEYQIAEQTTAAPAADIKSILSASEIVALQSLVRRVPAPAHALHFALRLVRASRPQADDAPAFIKDWVSWGSGPRGVQFLLLGAKARAVLHGRPAVSIADIKAIAQPVLRHRIVTSFGAESDGISADEVVERLLRYVSESETTGDLPPAVGRALSPEG